MPLCKSSHVISPTGGFISLRRNWCNLWFAFNPSKKSFTFWNSYRNFTLHNLVVKATICDFNAAQGSVGFVNSPFRKISNTSFIIFLSLSLRNKSIIPKWQKKYNRNFYDPIIIFLGDIAGGENFLFHHL